MGVPGLIPILSNHEVLKNSFVYFTEDNFIAELEDMVGTNQIQNLCFDLPGEIHKATSRMLGYGEYKRVAPAVQNIEDLDSLTDAVSIIVTNLIRDVSYLYLPEYIIIAMDGSVPAAKMKQQRERRYKSVANLKSGIFDTNQITAGSVYMKMLETKIIKKLRELTNSNQITNIIFIPQGMYGEGEHKIMDYLRNNASGDRYQVIYGADTDLLILSLSQYTNIIMRREDNLLHVSIPRFHQGLSYLGINPIDFITAISLIGNDFIPHHDVTTKRSIMTNVVNLIISILPNFQLTYSYINEFGHNRRNDAINWEQLYGLLYELNKYESEWLGEFCTTLVQEGNNSFLYKTTYDGLDQEFTDNWYRREIFHGQASVSASITDQYGETKSINIRANSEIINTTRDDMCKNICYGLQWITSYYMRGSNYVDSEWSYPYTYMPLFNSLAWYITNNANDLSGIVNQVVRTELNIGYHYLTHLMIVLPPSSWRVSMNDRDIEKITSLATSPSTGGHFARFPTSVTINSKDLTRRDRPIFYYKEDGDTRIREGSVNELPEMYYHVYLPYIDVSIIKNMIGLQPSANIHITSIAPNNRDVYQANNHRNRVNVINRMIIIADSRRANQHQSNTSHNVIRRRERQIVTNQERHRANQPSRSTSKKTSDKPSRSTSRKTSDKPSRSTSRKPTKTSSEVTKINIYAIDPSNILEIPLEE